MIDRFSLAFIGVRSMFILIKEKGKMTTCTKTLKLISAFSRLVGTFWGFY